MDTRDRNSGISSPMESELTDITGDVLSMPAAPEEEEEKSSTPLQDSLRRLRRDRRAMISIGIILLLVVIALFGPFIYQRIGGTHQSDLNEPIGPNKYHSYFYGIGKRADELPSAQYWLGTDNLGYDILARLMQGLFVSLTVVTLVEALDILLGMVVGLLAGYYGGWIDQLLARFIDIMFAFPSMLFLILLTSIFGGWTDDHLSSIPLIGAHGNARLLLIVFALAFTTWPMMARYVRGQTLQLKEQQFIEAARASGTSDARIIRRHIIPNLFSIVIVVATLDIPGMIMNEAGISLLGLGVQAPGSSIGLMISAAIQGAAFTHPWEILVPCVVLVIIVLAFSFLGDGLRDAFDPRSKD